MKKLKSHSLNQKFSSSEADVAYIVEHTLGYKWMLIILRLIRQGTNRPGAITRAATGLTNKVLNERLSILVELGILEKIVFVEIPPHVEYVFTDFGLKFVEILDLIDDLEDYRQSLQAEISAKQKKIN